MSGLRFCFNRFMFIPGRYPGNTTEFHVLNISIAGWSSSVVGHISCGMRIDLCKWKKCLFSIR